MSEIEDAIKEVVENKDDWSMNSWIAGFVAVAATLMAIGNIKDGNIVQNMAQLQAKSVDAWSYYQAKSLKQLMSENAAQQLQTFIEVTPSMSPVAREGMQKSIAKHEVEARRYEKEKEEIKGQAEGYEKEVARLNIHDDQFDMAEACLTVSIALFGVTALTRRKWLFFFGAGLMLLGLLLEFAGFMELSLHPEWLARLLG